MIEEPILSEVLAAGLRGGAEFAEVFVEDRRSTSAVLDDGRVEDVATGRDRGAGIRVVVGESTGFAHTTDLSADGLKAAAETAAAAARGGTGGTTVVDLTQVQAPSPSVVRLYPGDVPTSAKVELLGRADSAARSAGSSITQVSARYGDTRRRIQVANSDGVLASDDQVRTLFSVSAVASGDTGLQTGRESIGHTVGFELFDDHSVEELAERAAQRAITKLAARPAPSGTRTVVIGPGGGGVMFHEACGHGLEADLVGKGASVFAGRVGEQVASPLVTLVDDGTMGGEWGAFAIDDEGRPAQRNTLIQDGVLTEFMWDLLRARKEGRPSSGNGRRQSYQHLPMVRMTNTYLLGGDSDPADIVADTPSGVYVAHLGGGQVNTATGDFVFGMTEAYLIEDGAITEPLRDGNLIGNGPAVLASIDAVGNDFAMGAPGTCGKDGQGVPVGDGVPTLRVGGLTVGGTAGVSRGDASAVVLETPDALLERAEAALDGARAGEQVEVSLGSSMDTELRAYDGAIESLSSSRSDGALVRVIADGGRAGVATGSLTTPEALAELLAEARANAADAGADPTMALAEPDGVAQPALELYDPRIEELSIDDKRDLALGLEAAVMAGDPRMVGVEGADYGDSVVVSAIATTAGIRAAQRESGAGLSVYAMATEHGETQTGFGFAVGRAAHELSVERTAAEAVLRTVRLLGSAKPPSGRVDVVLDPWVTAQFLGVIAEMLSGEEVRKGRTPFAGRVGEAIASPLVSLADDPTDARAPGASLTDDEGLACRPVPLIDGGALTSYLHNSITGAVLGGASTGSATRSGTSLGVGPRAVALRPGTTPRSEVLSGVGEGVLVTEVSGLHSGVNPTSGDFSCGIEGLRIRGGEEAEPIREAIVASTLQRMLTAVVAVGDDESWFPIDASGVSLAIEGLSLAGA